MCKRIATLAFVILIPFALAGCGKEKDYSKEHIDPIGQPNPQLQAISPGGTNVNPPPATIPQDAKPVSQ